MSTMASYVRRSLLLLGLVTACFYLQLHTESTTSSILEEHLSNDNEPNVRVKVPKVRKHPNAPLWTDKFPFFPDEDEVVDNRVCFVHVGKTAGSTLACYFGFRYPACGNRVELLPGQLVNHTTNIIHTRFDTCKRTDISVYLFVLRDPLSRMQSWFTYERPRDENSPEYEMKKRLFVDCEYKTLNQMGADIGSNTTLCSRRAWRAMTGLVGYSRHNKFNYGYYYNRVPRNARIAVIRTEHLEADWSSLEVKLFNGKPLNKSAGYFKRKNQSQKLDEDLLLTVESRLNLCKALCEEIQLYKKLLSQAENLTPEDVQESLTELKSSCPYQARSDKC
jgi:hypothetical protein